MKGVIFDMDGTMFDSEKIWRDMWRHLPLEYGYEEDLTIGEDMCGTSGKQSQLVAANHFPDLDPVEFCQRGVKRYEERLLAAQPEEKPGLHEIIHALYEKGFRMAVASGSPQKVIRRNIERAGLTEYFDALVSGFDVANAKPEPDIFLESARRIGCDPKDCYVIEDGENGILAAVAAGCRAIMVPDLTAPDEELTDMCYDVQPSLLDVILFICKKE